MEGEKIANCIILVVEDNAEIRDLLVDILEEENLSVRGVRSGVEALAILERDAIDLIILDLVLPDVSGIALIPQIRTRRSNTTILALSGSPDGLKLAQDQGVDATLAKPFDLEVLLEIVSRLCPARGRQSRSSPANA